MAKKKKQSKKSVENKTDEAKATIAPDTNNQNGSIDDKAKLGENEQQPQDNNDNNNKAESHHDSEGLNNGTNTKPSPVSSEVSHEENGDKHDDIIDGNTVVKGDDYNGAKIDNDRIIALEQQIAQLTQELTQEKTNVESLRKELEGVSIEKQETNVASESKDPSSVDDEKLKQITKERDDIKASYDALLSRISSMKSVFSKMKESENEVEVLREEKDKLNLMMADITKQNQTLLTSNNQLNKDNETLKTEINDLNNECEKLTKSLTSSRKDFSQRETILKDENYELEDKLNKNLRLINDYKSTINEFKLLNDDNKLEILNLNLIIDDLKSNNSQKGQEIASLKLTIDQINNEKSTINQSIIDLKSHHANELLALNNKIDQLQNDNGKLSDQLQEQSLEITKLTDANHQITTLEKELETKQILLGKSRHESIILNEHLTKALGMLKQQLSNSDNTIDKELISNVIINFLTIPRGDTKKFEALQLISSLLQWDEAKKIASGLSNQGNHSNDTKPKERESFISLWTDFLERESTKK